MTNANSKPHEVVFAAIVYLSGQCNGAIDVDGAGFNKFDATNGHRMADIIRSGGSLSMLDYQRALGFVTKYRKQLELRAIAVNCEVTDEPLSAQEININKANLNNQQIHAFDGVVAWATKEHGESKAVLIGYAGTGKTYLMQRIAKELQSHNKDVCFTAPTNKACQVLSKMALENNLRVDVMTTHKLLGLAIERDHDGNNVLEQASEPSYYKYDLVLIDEASMISAEMDAFIPLSVDTKFLFMGDPCQLPPITSKKKGAKKDLAGFTPALPLAYLPSAPIEEEPKDNTISPCFSLDKQWHLTEVVRYDGAIFKYVTDIRENINHKQLPFKQFKRNEFESLNSDEWHQQLITRFKAIIDNGDYQKDSNLLRALAYTNRRVQEINDFIRDEIYGKNIAPYIVGERLIAKEMIQGNWQEIKQKMDDDFNINRYSWSEQKWNTGSKYTILNSCGECTITDVESQFITVQGSKFATWRLEIETDLGDRAVVNILDLSEKDKSIQLFGGWRKLILTMPNNTPSERDDRKTEWKKFYRALDALCVMPSGNTFMRKLQYAFALTIHQSQGSTFETVFADTSNVYGCPEVKLRNQLLYVMGSRASKKLFLHDKFKA